MLKLAENSKSLQSWNYQKSCKNQTRGIYKQNNKKNKAEI